MIVRYRREHNYAIVANKILEHPQLIFAVNWLLVYLLGRPDNWPVRSDREHVTRRPMRELEAADYLVRIRTSDGCGQFPWVSTVYDMPHAPADL